MALPYSSSDADTQRRETRTDKLRKAKGNSGLAVDVRADACSPKIGREDLPSSAERPIGEVIDLFCGVGGISHGFKRAGFRVVAGYDIDEGCRYAFETNNDSRFVSKNLDDVTPDELRKRFSGALPTVLVGCAPCQPFSSYKKGKSDD